MKTRSSLLTSRLAYATTAGLLSLCALGSAALSAPAHEPAEPAEPSSPQVRVLGAADDISRAPLVAVLDVSGPKLSDWISQAEGYLKKQLQRELESTESPIAQRKIKAQLRALKLDQLTLAELSEALREAFGQRPRLKTITRDELDRLLPPKLRGAPASVPELIERGRALGADWIVETKASLMGPILKVDWGLYEVTRGERIASHYVWAKDPRALVKDLGPISERLYVSSLGKVNKREELKREAQRARHHKEFLKKMFTRPPKTRVEDLPVTVIGEAPLEPVSPSAAAGGSESPPNPAEAARPKTRAELAQERADKVLEELAEETRRLEARLEKARKTEENLLEVRIKDGLSEWAELSAQLGRGPTQEQLKAQEGRWSWADITNMLKSDLDVERQRSLLLNFINEYGDLQRLYEQVEEAKLRYTWLSRELQWVTIRDGRFLIGSPQAFDDEWPMQWVEIKAFQGSISEVTNAQYYACVSAGRCSPPHWDDARCHIFEKKRLFMGQLPKIGRRGDMPVVCVTWQQAKTFAEWAGGRLFSESEWEFTARSGDRTRIYPWGRDEPSCERSIMAVPIVMGRFDAKHFETGCGLSTFWPVCSRPAGSNSYGMCDLAGNVWEWVMDSYRPNHEAVPTDGSPVLGGGLKVIRGGSFASSGRELRASTRGQQIASRPASYIGFRVARSYSIDGTEQEPEDDDDDFLGGGL